MALLSLLALVMAATRMDHYGGALALPDASLAVFFLAGLWLRASWSFPVLLLVALGVDLAALAQSGLGADCLSPAYPFLIAAYGALWAAGRRVAAFDGAGLLRGATAVAVAASVAFLISNLSWFAFSGQFAPDALARFVAMTLPQAPHYVGWTVSYAVLGLVTHRALGGVGLSRRVATS